MDWNILNIILLTLLVSLGALLQAVTGLGGGLIIVPLLALISIELIPGPMIFGSLALSSVMAFSGRKNIDFSNFEAVIGGLLLGTIVATLYIATLPIEKLGVVFGVFILCAVFMSVKIPKFSFNSKGFAIAGILSGFMGTSVGIGAPILAIIYQNHSGPSLRATLAFLYFVSSITTLVFLNMAGRFGVDEIISGMFLMLGFIIGYFMSPKIAKYVDRGYARPAVLIVSTISAGLLIWRSVQ